MTPDVPPLGLLIGYGMLIAPLAILLYRGVDLLGRTLISVVRMTVQLLFVGFYLQVLFAWNHPLVNVAWLVVMLSVADGAILRSCELKVGRLAPMLLLSLLAGTLVPLLYFIGLILWQPDLLDARLMIPLGGMILGNCMKTDIIGLRTFYDELRGRRRSYQHALAQGARLGEALRPFHRRAIRAALAPTVASMATIGLVALPGMMTGVMLGGRPPMTAILYQIAIMLAIFCGTAVTVFVALILCSRTSFDAYGRLREDIFS